MRLGFTSYGASHALDLLLNIAAWAAPTFVYLGMSTDDPGWHGSMANEPVLTRQAITLSLIAADLLEQGRIVSFVVVGFPVATTSFTATHAFISDAVTGGNMIFRARLKDQLGLGLGIPQVDSALPIEFPIGDIVIGIDDEVSIAYCLTNYARKAILDHACGLIPYTTGPKFLGIFQDNPGDDGVLTSELSGNAYSRVSIDGKIAATDIETGIATSNVEIVFPQATGLWEGSFLGIADAATAGNLIWRSASRRLIQVASGEILRFPPGQLAFKVH